jgi:hypothetical protein
VAPAMIEETGMIPSDEAIGGIRHKIPLGRFIKFHPSNSKTGESGRSCRSCRYVCYLRIYHGPESSDV